MRVGTSTTSKLRISARAAGARVSPPPGSTHRRSRSRPPRAAAADAGSPAGGRRRTRREVTDLDLAVAGDPHWREGGRGEGRARLRALRELRHMAPGRRDRRWSSTPPRCAARRSRRTWRPATLTGPVAVPLAGGEQSPLRRHGDLERPPGVVGERAPRDPCPAARGRLARPRPRDRPKTAALPAPRPSSPPSPRASGAGRAAPLSAARRCAAGRGRRARPQATVDGAGGGAGRAGPQPPPRRPRPHPRRLEQTPWSSTNGALRRERAGRRGRCAEPLADEMSRGTALRFGAHCTTSASRRTRRSATDTSPIGRWRRREIVGANLPPPARQAASAATCRPHAAPPATASSYTRRRCRRAACPRYRGRRGVPRPTSPAHAPTGSRRGAEGPSHRGGVEENLELGRRCSPALEWHRDGQPPRSCAATRGAELEGGAELGDILAELSGQYAGR